MDPPRSVALTLGLLLCLALLGSWFVGLDKEDAPSAESPAAAESNARKPAAEVVPVPSKAPQRDDASSDPAPLGPGVFRGRVIDAATRQPIREFTVEFYSPRQAGHPEPPPPVSRSFRTNDGRFEYRGLPAGTGTFVTTARGYQRFDIADVRLAEHESAKELLIPMRAGHVLRGRVVDEVSKDGIANALLTFREASVGRYQGFRTPPSVHSQKDGSFVLVGVPPGGVRIETSAPNYAGKEVQLFISPKTPPVEIALSKGGTIAGYLAGADGITPIAGQVSLGYLDDGEGLTHSGATSGAGEFSFTQLKAGRYLLGGQGGGLSSKREIELSHNEHLEGIVLAMSPGYSVRGVVSGLRPEERAGTSVHLFAQSVYSGLSQQSRLDERGAYEVRGVAPGSVRVQATAETRGTVAKVVQMPANGDLTVNFEFKPGARLSGRVTLGGQPLAGVMLHPRSKSFEEPDVLALPPFVTSKSGEYGYEDVPDGEYVIAIETYTSPIVRVSGDTVFDIDIPDVQLSGYVFEEGSKVPVVGASIHLRPTQRRPHGNRLASSSNNFGQFGIRGLQPGNFVLSAYKGGFELYRAPLSYGSPISDMTIYMCRAQGVELKVRDADNNKPVANIVVVENVEGFTGIVFEAHPDQEGVSYLPAGLAGSALTFSTLGYHPLQVIDWNGQQLDLSLQRER